MVDRKKCNHIQAQGAVNGPFTREEGWGRGDLQLRGALFRQEVVGGGGLLGVWGKGHSLEQHGVAGVLEGGQHLRAATKQDALRLLTEGK